MFVKFLLLAAFAAQAPAAQDRTFQWKQADGSSAPARPSQASKDGFGVMLLVTADYEKFLEAWAGPTPPNLPTTSEVSEGKPVHTMVIFSGCRAAADGNCKVTAEFSIMSPDGSVYDGPPKKGPIWTGAPATGYNLQLGDSGLGFRLEPNDRAGVYKIKAVVTDEVANSIVTVEEQVTAIKTPAAKPAK
ncbi:MAG TPA: hypothetical protein VF637_17120 [Sphingomicrobium sp.]|jgi:hypothetical protein